MCEPLGTVSHHDWSPGLAAWIPQAALGLECASGLGQQASGSGAAPIRERASNGTHFSLLLLLLLLTPFPLPPPHPPVIWGKNKNQNAVFGFLCREVLALLPDYCCAGELAVLGFLPAPEFCPGSGDASNPWAPTPGFASQGCVCLSPPHSVTSRLQEITSL